LLTSAFGPHDTKTVSLRSWGVPDVHRLGWAVWVTLPLLMVPVPPVTPVMAERDVETPV
jgi:hypothetical protein